MRYVQFCRQWYPHYLVMFVNRIFKLVFARIFLLVSIGVEGGGAFEFHPIIIFVANPLK